MASSTKIPLKCDICPKKPRFSDISHLLAHICSKTHLSNIFKARVRLDIDTESRRLVEDYDQWYAEWSIQDLLAERLSQKDNKMAKPRARPAPAGVGHGRGRGPARPATVSTAAGLQQVAGEPMFGVDPNLQPFSSQGGRRGGPIPNAMFPVAVGSKLIVGGSSYGLGSIPQTRPILNGQPFPHLLPPHMQPGYVHPPPGSRPIYGSWGPMARTAFTEAVHEQPEIDPVNGKREAAVVAFERIKRDLRQATGEAESLTQLSETTDTSLSDDWSLVSTPAGSVFAYTGELQSLPNLKLKGIIFPGMGCFDAADTHQKSQRNRKKSDGAYALLERTSVIVEGHPWEATFLPADDDEEIWVPFKARIITGQPAPSSLASSPASSRNPSPVRQTRSVLHNRTAPQPPPSTDHDDQVENNLNDKIFPRGRLPVYRQAEVDDDDQSVDTFAGRLSRAGNPMNQRILNFNQENGLSGNLSANAIVKTSADGTDPGALFVLPSTEGHSESTHYALLSNSLVGPAGQMPMLLPPSPFAQTLPPPSPLGHSSPRGMFGFGVSEAYFNNGMPRFQSPIQPNITSPSAHHGFAPAPRYFHPSMAGPGMPFHYHSPTAPVYGYNYHAGMHGMNTGMNATGRLNNLPHVASKDLGSDNWMGGNGDEGGDKDRTLTAPGSPSGGAGPS